MSAKATGLLTFLAFFIPFWFISTIIYLDPPLEDTLRALTRSIIPGILISALLTFVQFWAMRSSRKEK